MPRGPRSTPSAGMLRGGFPPSHTATTDARSTQWCQDLIQTFLQRDLPHTVRGLRWSLCGKVN